MTLSLYNLFAKPILFALDPEVAHDLTLSKLALASKSDFLTKQIERMYASKVPDLPVECMGLKFRHPVGLAAGLDKNAVALPAFSALGFSGVEMGTVTPKPQPGNEKPRIFRLPEDEGLINRLGFNSDGVDTFLANITKTNNTSVAGINIGKNAITAIEDAHFDYISALKRACSQADYIAVNVSSPNTKSLRDLQNENFLDNLLTQIMRAKDKCEQVHKRDIPIALKVAPDLSADEIEVIAELVMAHQFDALIASNTTVSRPDSLLSEHAPETGGLSGAPVKDMSTECIREFYNYFKGEVQIIGVGGIKNADDAWEKMLAGADYVQIYSQFIYQGPNMIKQIVSGLKDRVEAAGFDNLPEALISLRK